MLDQKYDKLLSFRVSEIFTNLRRLSAHILAPNVGPHWTGEPLDQQIFSPTRRCSREDTFRKGNQ